ncbi:MULTISPECIES: hypothetical protein [unclassified Bosea (in: a-proteobacteria)]|uniref:HNH endonuclease n=1 Tax=unclassified Bosea (in: a-proteobacteria) TaxID=2653178 RepID=UPI000F75E49A|nr:MULTISPECIES: hypothetical protein [unclassified Bosea (in: a-proteobacteria)]AZO77522.1 hypothetical protein BLM15_07755 [Bosea sp. Tri-49]RXT18130.1 hypothetical protein B5U98_22920 [Bosea sp. Tri-39]RXT32727.1 hypothetical protein B5U99_29265 [Bosea sp. Tri-54]
MPFVRDDVGTTTRLRMTGTRALRAWERTKGVCVNCELPIDGTKDDWFVEHVRALELGGADEDENLGPSHLACKPAKDAADHAAAGKAKRNKRAELGIRPPSRLRGPGFRKYPRQHTATRKLQKPAAWRNQE